MPNRFEYLKKLEFIEKFKIARKGEVITLVTNESTSNSLRRGLLTEYNNIFDIQRDFHDYPNVTTKVIYNSPVSIDDFLELDCVRSALYNEQ